MGRNQQQQYSSSSNNNNASQQQQQQQQPQQKQPARTTPRTPRTPRTRRTPRTPPPLYSRILSDLWWRFCSGWTRLAIVIASVFIIKPFPTPPLWTVGITAAVLAFSFFRLVVRAANMRIQLKGNLPDTSTSAIIFFDSFSGLSFL